MPTFDDPTALFDDPNFLFGGGIGDLITQDYQIEFQGLLMGPGTSYKLKSVDGLAMPDVRTADVNRPRDQGQLAGQDFLTGRDIILDIVVTGTTEALLYNNIEVLAAATAPTADPAPMVFQLPGQPKKRAVVRARKRHSTVNYIEASGSIQEFTVQFHAVDPRLYDNNLQTIPLALPGVSGGLGFVVGFPAGFGNAVGGQVAVFNNGVYPTRPLVTFYGPLTSPTISNLTTGDVFSTTFDLHGGDILVVDFDYRTVLVNDVPSSLGGSRYSYVVAGSAWWELPPGGSYVSIGATAGTGAATFAFRSAWL